VSSAPSFPAIRFIMSSVPRAVISELAASDLAKFAQFTINRLPLIRRVAETSRRRQRERTAATRRRVVLSRNFVPALITDRTRGGREARASLRKVISRDCKRQLTGSEKARTRKVRRLQLRRGGREARARPIPAQSARH